MMNRKELNVAEMEQINGGIILNNAANAELASGLSAGLAETETAKSKLAGTLSDVF